jgi:cytochrome c biogenesis protein CcdA
LSRRALYFICGIAVLFASLLYAHVFHHVFFVERQEWNAAFVTGLILSAVAGVFSFVGAYLLLTGGRNLKAE